jgi:hypothetical protein
MLGTTAAGQDYPGAVIGMPARGNVPDRRFSFLVMNHWSENIEVQQFESSSSARSLLLCVIQLR